MTNKKIVKLLLPYGYQIFFLLFLANFGVVYYVVKFRIQASSCLTVAQVQSDNRCLYILGGKIYEMGSRGSPHHGHPCGMDVSSIIPSNHLSNVIKYLDPRYRTDLCPATPAATATPIPTNTTAPTATIRPIPTNTTKPVPTATIKPTSTNTPIPTATSKIVPTNTVAQAKSNTPIPTATTILNPTNTVKPTNTNTVQPTATNKIVPTNTVAQAKSNTPIPTATTILNPTSTISEVVSNTPTVTITLAPVVTPGDQIIDSQPSPTGQVVTEATETVTPEQIESIPPEDNSFKKFFYSLSFSGWWGMILVLAGCGTVISSLVIGRLFKKVSIRKTTDSFRPRIINQGRLYFAKIHSRDLKNNLTWLTLTNKDGTVFGQVSGTITEEGWYYIDGRLTDVGGNNCLIITSLNELKR